MAEVHAMNDGFLGDGLRVVLVHEVPAVVFLPMIVVASGLMKLKLNILHERRKNEGRMRVSKDCSRSF